MNAALAVPYPPFAHPSAPWSARVDGLPEAARAIARAAAGMEPSGEALGSLLLAIRDRLGTATADIAAGAGRMGGSAIADLPDQIAARIAQIEEDAAALRTLLRVFDRQSADLRAALSVVGRLTRVEMCLRQLLTLAQVEINRLDDAQTLRSFAETMQKLVDAFASIGTALQRRAREASGVLTDATRIVSQGIATLDGPLRTLAASRDTLLGEAGQVVARALARTGEVGRLIGALDQRVGAAVRLIQDFDRLRQWGEHIAAAITIAEDLVAAGDPASGITPDAGPAAARSVLVLQADQLARLVTRHAAHAGEIDATFADLDALAAAVAEAAGDGRTLAPLLGAATRAFELAARAEAAVDTARATAVRIEGETSALGAHILELKKLEQEIRVLSLNATVKSYTLGPRGAALKAIAAEIRGISLEAEGAIASLSATLHAFAGAEIAADHGGPRGDLGALGAALRAQAEDEGALVALLSDTLADVGVQVRDGRGVAAAHAATGRDLAAREAPLATAIAALPAPRPGEADSEPFRALRARLEAAYTTPEERGERAAAAPAAVSAAEIDDLLF